MDFNELTKRRIAVLIIFLILFSGPISNWNTKHVDKDVNPGTQENANNEVTEEEIVNEEPSFNENLKENAKEAKEKAIDIWETAKPGLSNILENAKEAGSAIIEGLTEAPEATEATEETKNTESSSLEDLIWTHEQIIYSPLDEYNRAGVATAYLSSRNLGSSEGRESQVWKPTGWNNSKKTKDGKSFYPQHRGHLIAYTLSFNFDNNGNYVEGLRGSEDNPYNLITQSSHSNQGAMLQVENQVRSALNANKKVIYRVTPVFVGTELMAREVIVEAYSTDGTLNIKEVIPNTHPNVDFDYQTGKSTLK